MNHESRIGGHSRQSVDHRARLVQIGCTTTTPERLDENRGRQCAAVVPAVIHASIVSPLVRHVCHIATGMLSTSRTHRGSPAPHDLHPY